MRRAVLLILLFSAGSAFAADRSFTVLLSPGIAPCTIHVNGLTAVPDGVDVTCCKFNWDFGDPQTPFDTLHGFNAAHCYNHAGSYTIALSFTDPAGVQRSMTAKVVIGKDTRHLIFVSPDGGDASPGLSPDAPARSLPRVFDKLIDDSEVLLRAGATYPLESSLQLQRRNILIGRYGDGPDPVIIKQNHGPIIATQNKCDGVIIEHLKFTTPNGVQADGKAPKVGTDAVVGRGRNITLRDCVFDNVDIAFNGNGSPTGVLVQNCKAPTVTSLRAYMVWGQGTDQVYLGNEDANSTQEHCIRTSGVNRALIAYNTLANHGSKGCIEVHVGGYVWVTNNTVSRGDIRTGPLGLHEAASTATEWCVIENNVVNDSCIFVQRGSHHIRVRNNIIHADGRQAIIVSGPDQDGRICNDITIAGNTAVNHDTAGAFLRIWGKTEGLSLTNNLYIAPNLRPGKSGTFFVATQQPDLSDFTAISNNVWPALENSNTEFGLGSSGTCGPDKWTATKPVEHDRFENIKWNDPTSQPVK